MIKYIVQISGGRNVVCVDTDEVIQVFEEENKYCLSSTIHKVEVTDIFYNLHEMMEDDV